MTRKPDVPKITQPSTFATRAAENAERASGEDAPVKRRRINRLDYSEPVTVPARIPVAERPSGARVFHLRRGTDGTVDATIEENQ